MKIIRQSTLRGTARDVQCPRGGFTSLRFLLAKDGMGFSFHITEIPVGPAQFWHYKHHLEACYCIEGRGILTQLDTGERFEITPRTLYVLDKHDAHTFQAITPVTLVSVFNPACTGAEVHGEDGAYEAADE